jgi:hypothetical protein
VTSATTVALAGLGGGAGGTHSWTGTVNNSWHNSGNWNTRQVPAVGDAVIILGGANNVLLFADTPEVESLYVGGSRAISNNGHVIRVTDGDAATTVTGAGSSLFVTPGGAPFGLITDTLSVESDADLDMNGGWVRVDEQLDLLSGGRIFGHGYVDIVSPLPAALNGIGGSELTVSGGDLHVRIFNGGSMALPGTINILEPNTHLNLSGALLTPINDVNLGSDTEMIVGEDWTLAGQLSVDTNPGELSSVDGDGTMTVDGHVSVTGSSYLRLDNVARFEGTSSASIGTIATLEVNDWFDTDPGHVTTIGLGGRLLIEALPFAGGWQGDIESSAGIIEINGPGGLSVAGTLHFGSFAGIRTLINGTTVLRAMGDVNAPGLGASVNGTLDLRPTATMTLGNNAQIIANGEVLLRAGSDTEGSGQLTVNGGGSLVIEETATVHADIVNDGAFRAGSGSNAGHYVYIFGTYVQGATGQLKVDIGGSSPFDRDAYETSAGIDLAGELVVNLTDGFVPEVGDEFEIFWANGGITGTFDAVTGEPGFSVSYSVNTVTLTYEGVNSCPADATGDGVVNVDDLLQVIFDWGVCDGCAADVDQSGLVDVDDLLQVIFDWGGCP